MRRAAASATAPMTLRPALAPRWRRQRRQGGRGGRRDRRPWQAACPRRGGRRRDRPPAAHAGWREACPPFFDQNFNSKAKSVGTRPVRQAAANAAAPIHPAARPCLAAAPGRARLPHEVDYHVREQEYADAAADDGDPGEYLLPPLHAAPQGGQDNEPMRGRPQLCASARAARGGVIFGLGRDEEVLVSYDTVVAPDPGCAVTHLAKAPPPARLGRDEEAPAACGTATGLDPALSDAHMSRADMLAGAGLDAGALAACGSAVETDGPRRRAHTLRKYPRRHGTRRRGPRRVRQVDQARRVQQRRPPRQVRHGRRRRRCPC